MLAQPCPPNAHTDSRKKYIAQYFSAAAAYDQYALVQRDIAQRLAQQLVSLDLPAAPAVLEIGAGTGFLTEEITRLLPTARSLLITDLSAAMLERCRQNLAGPEQPSLTRLNFAVMDGEHPALLAGQWDLIVSSLAMQWFTNPRCSLTRLKNLLTTKGQLLFSTLGADTFIEWRTLVAKSNQTSAVAHYTSKAELAALLEQATQLPTSVEEDYICVDYPTPRDFLITLKKIGAHLPGPTSSGMAPEQLRRILNQWECDSNSEAKKFSVTYHVLFGRCGR